MIKNIIFDMGGVLIRFDRGYFIERLGVSGEDEKLLMNQVFRSLEWVQMDRGVLTDAQAAEIIRGRVPERLHDAVNRLVSMWDRPILPVEGMEELIAELKGLGYPIYLLSNASCRQGDYWPRIPASRYFDGTLVSWSVRLVKPQPEIYYKLCATFGLRMDECIFIDDDNGNIEGAAFAGMRGIVFNGDVSEVRRRLIAEGVPVRE